MTLDSVAEPAANFEGISDFSDVVTNVVNTVAAVVRNRVESFINGGDLYGIDQKLSAFVNKVIHMIPDQIELGKGLYIDGFLYSDLTASNNVLSIPMQTQIRYDNVTFDSSGCQATMHVPIEKMIFDLQLAVNDCAANELLFSLYEAGLLKATL